jgi:DNA-binding NarL/FixJ family response regulator
MRCSALSVDLMDRSKYPEGTAFARRAEELDPGAQVVAVDLARPDGLAAIERLRSSGTSARIVAYGSHVDTDLLEAARQAGADDVLARSVFFADVEAALAGPT